MFYNVHQMNLNQLAMDSCDSRSDFNYDRMLFYSNSTYRRDYTVLRAFKKRTLWTLNFHECLFNS